MNSLSGEGRHVRPVGKDSEQGLDRAVERLKTGHHVTPALIEAYDSGELTRAAGELLIAHMAKCPQCAEIALLQMGVPTPARES